MTFPSFTKNDKNQFVVFDIGNGSVGGAIVKRSINEDGYPVLELVKSERVQISLGEHVNFEDLLKKMIKAVNIVAGHISKKIPTKNPLMYVILASPWYSSQTKLVTIKKDGRFVFSREFSNDIINKETKNFKDEISKRNNSGNENLSVIEGRVIHVSLNGYDSPIPYDNTISEAKLAIYSSITEERILATLKDILIRYFPRAVTTFHSFPLAHFFALKELFPEKQDFLMMDVSSEITDVSLIRSGILMETVSFPLGRNFLMRRIASGLKRTMNEAESLHAIFSTDSLSDESKEKVFSILERARTEWLNNFSKALVNLSKELYVPNEIFLSIDKDISATFISWIEKEALSQYTFSHEKFYVVSLSRAIPTLSRYFKGGIQDQFIDIDALFAQKLVEAGW